MHVGMTTFFQNLTGTHSDLEVYTHDLPMAELAEPLGFASIWTSVAEDISVLDHVSNGRANVGFGRGPGRIEFEGLRVAMGESRQRFAEYDGTLCKQPKVAIRPAPFAQFDGRVYASEMSPESARIMARLGIGIMIIAQKLWGQTLAQLEEYRGLYREFNDGTEAPSPPMVVFNACRDDAEIAQGMHAKYITRYAKSALDHYGFNNEGLTDIKGYEYFGGLSENIKKHGIDSFVTFLVDLQVSGTPDQVFNRLCEYQQMTNCTGLINAFIYRGMPHALGKTSMRTLARKVMPRLKALPVGATVGSNDALGVAA